MTSHVTWSFWKHCNNTIKLQGVKQQSQRLWSQQSIRYRWVPLDPNFDNPNFDNPNSWSIGSNMEIWKSHADLCMLICPLNLKFVSIKGTFTVIFFFRLSGRHLYRTRDFASRCFELPKSNNYFSYKWTSYRDKSRCPWVYKKFL